MALKRTSTLQLLEIFHRLLNGVKKMECKANGERGKIQKGNFGRLTSDIDYRIKELKKKK